MTDAERLRDIEDKLLRWRYLSHYVEAEDDVRWLVAQLREREARIAALEVDLHALRTSRARGRQPHSARPGPGERLDRSERPAVSTPGRSVSAGPEDPPERPPADPA